jgi:hypothetical protein
MWSDATRESGDGCMPESGKWKRKWPVLVEGTGQSRKQKLLLVFFLRRIALFANLLGFGRFLAALVFAFFAGLFGLFAAGFGIGGNTHPRESARENCQQLNGLHFVGP